MLKKLLCSLMAAAFFLPPSHAQTSLSGFDISSAQDGMVNYLLQQNVLQNIFTAAPHAAITPQAYEYRPSPQVSRNVREEVIRALIAHGYRNGKLNTDTEPQLRAALEQADLMAEVNRELRTRGHDPNSVAAAITYWLVNNYNIIHGHISTDAEDRAVLRQAQYLLSQQPDMLRMSDAEKQSQAESLYWIATLQQFAYQQAQQGLGGYDMDSVVADAHAALMTYGIDAYQLRLTEQGLQPR